MAVNSAVVSVVKIAELCSPPSCSQGNNVILNVEEHLKGNEGDRFQFRIAASATTLTNWKSRSSRLLIFDHLGNDPSHASNEKLYVIDLSAYNLKILTADMTILSDPEQIIQVTKKAIHRHPNVYGMFTFSRHIPAETAAQIGSVLWPMTTVLADSDLEQWALSNLNSRQDMERAEAADALGYFPSEANAARLRPLLGDPALSNNGPGVANIYFVRQNAYRALVRMGVAVSKPVLQKEPDRR